MSRASFSPVCACVVADAFGARVAVIPELLGLPWRQGRCYSHCWYFVEMLSLYFVSLDELVSSNYQAPGIQI